MRHPSYPRTPWTFEQLLMAHQPDPDICHAQAIRDLARQIMSRPDIYSDETLQLAAEAHNKASSRLMEHKLEGQA